MPMQGKPPINPACWIHQRHQLDLDMAPYMAISYKHRHPRMAVARRDVRS